jgi:hypothetical protein
MHQNPVIGNWIALLKTFNGRFQSDPAPSWQHFPLADGK